MLDVSPLLTESFRYFFMLCDFDKALLLKSLAGLLTASALLQMDLEQRTRD